MEKMINIQDIINEHYLHPDHEGQTEYCSGYNDGFKKAVILMYQQMIPSIRHQVQKDGYDGFCIAHQLSYNEECPECKNI